MSHQAVDRAYLEEIQAKYGQGSTLVGEGNQQALLVETDCLLELLQELKTGAAYRYNMLRNVTAVDYKEYLEVIYHLYSLPLRRFITIKTRCTAEDPRVPSVTPIWPSANFQEREIYDLLGITFTGHPDLRRILMPDEFTGHPLRKSFQASQHNPIKGCN